MSACCGCLYKADCRTCPIHQENERRRQEREEMKARRLNVIVGPVRGDQVKRSCGQLGTVVSTRATGAHVITFRDIPHQDFTSGKVTLERCRRKEFWRFEDIEVVGRG